MKTSVRGSFFWYDVVAVGKGQKGAGFYFFSVEPAPFVLQFGVADGPIFGNSRE